jgi:hypothetical protein
MKTEIQSKDGPKVVNLNRRRAIREKCLNCSGWSLKEVEECSFKDTCSLFAYRMGRGKQNAKARNQAVSSYCTWCMAGNVYEVKRCTAPHCAFFVFRGSKADAPQKCPSLSKNAHIEVSFEANSLHPMVG